jgi:hypothetical protein
MPKTTDPLGKISVAVGYEGNGRSAGPIRPSPSETPARTRGPAGQSLPRFEPATRRPLTLPCVSLSARVRERMSPSRGGPTWSAFSKGVGRPMGVTLPRSRLLTREQAKQFPYCPETGPCRKFWGLSQWRRPVAAGKASRRGRLYSIRGSDSPVTGAAISVNVAGRVRDRLSPVRCARRTLCARAQASS